MRVGTSPSWKYALVASALVTGACGDDHDHDHDPAPDAGRLDGGAQDGSAFDGAPDGGMIDASDAAAPDAPVGDGGGADAVTTDATGPDGGTPPARRLLVTMSDYETGGLGLVQRDGGVVVAAGPAPDQDAIPAWLGGTGVVLDRGLGQIRWLNVDSLETTAMLDLDPPGSSAPYASNPTAVVAVSPTKAYVVLQARPELVIVDPSRGTRTGSVDLSMFVRPGDMDGNVDASDAVLAGDRLYVALGNYWFDSSFAIRFEGSEIAVVDVTTDSVVDMDTTRRGVQGLPCGNNPWRGLFVVGDELWIGATGDSFMRDGAIERRSRRDGMRLGVVLDETTAGGEINGFARISERRVVVLVDRTLRAFDPVAGWGSASTLADGIDGFVARDGVLWAWRRMGDGAGLRRFDATSGTETTPHGMPLVVGTLPVYAAAIEP
ncbi:MAG: hypothetical protein NZ898_13880 [Myxococcota bacterium]|nr:hypothetical protein [Myxococcota bacterium]MDW8363904.1 hypothetical protein [Myxococcales bacterium]